MHILNCYIFPVSFRAGPQHSLTIDNIVGVGTILSMVLHTISLTRKKGSQSGGRNRRLAIALV